MPAADDMAEADRSVVLVISDEAAQRAIMPRFLERRGYTALAAASGREGLALAASRAPRWKTLKGLTPYEAICETWAAEPKRFTPNPLQQTPGLNNALIPSRPG